MNITTVKLSMQRLVCVITSDELSFSVFSCKWTKDVLVVVTVAAVICLLLSV